MYRVNDDTLKLTVMEKFQCDSDLCVYREINTIPEFETLEDSECIDITIDKNGNISYDSTFLFTVSPILNGLTKFIQVLIEKEFIPKNCSVGVWYLCDFGLSLNIIGYYLDENGKCDVNDDEPTIDYFINLV